MCRYSVACLWKRGEKDKNRKKVGHFFFFIISVQCNYKLLQQVVAESLWPIKVQGFFSVQGFNTVLSRFRIPMKLFKRTRTVYKPWTVKKNLEPWKSRIKTLKKTLNCEKNFVKTLKKRGTVKNATNYCSKYFSHALSKNLFSLQASFVEEPPFYDLVISKKGKMA